MEPHESISLPDGLKSLHDMTEIADNWVALDLGGRLLEFALKLEAVNGGSMVTQARKRDCFDNPKAVQLALEVAATPSKRTEVELERARVWIERAIHDVATRLPKGQRECVIGISALNVDARFVPSRDR